MEDTKIINSNCCREIYVILNKLNLFYKLPEFLQNYISTNQDLSHSFDFDENLPLAYQIENEETKAYISYIFFKYISDNVTEKKLLIDMYEKNANNH